MNAVISVAKYTAFLVMLFAFGVFSLAARILLV